MDDPNIIACLYPADGDRLAQEAICMRENSGRYIQPQGEIKPERGSRASTVKDDEDDPTSFSGLQLAFNPGPKTGQGLVIGHDRNRCDIVLPRLRHISGRHCALTFDAERRLILRDLSTNGTSVEYDDRGGEQRRTIITCDDQGREKRHYFSWILSGGEASRTEKIVIRIQDVKFQIIISKHVTHLDRFNDNVDRFLCETNADDELPFGALGIQSSTSTAQQSGAHTPTPQTPIYINQWRLGSGRSSIVNRVWDVSTGSVYASKEFLNRNESQWRKEASIMSQVLQLSNEHIIQFVALIERPSPRLILEYLPLGNLEDQHRQQSFSDQESLTILCQSLDALTSIHENSIVHRDVKPENILVQSRNPLHIKFADFGLSKATADLQTFCGTLLYAAPEIYTTRRPTYYTKACDIWSLGVVVFQYAFGPLPKSEKRDVGLGWCKNIIKLIDDWDNDPLLDFLSTAMLVIEPEKRLSTRKCWEQALQLSAPSQSRCPTPNHRLSMQETNGAASSQAAVDNYLIGCDTEEQELENQRSLVISSNEGETLIRKARNMKRKTDLAPSRLKRQPNTPTQSTRQSSSAVQRSKRTRQKEPKLALLRSESVEGTDIFKSNWVQVSDCGGSFVAGTGEDVDEQSSRLSELTSSHFGKPVPAKGFDVLNEQNSNQGSLSKEIEEPSEQLPEVGDVNLLHTPVNRQPMPGDQDQDNVSTRSLRFDRKGQIYMVIRREAVTMYTVDWKLNATQISRAAGLEKGSRDRYLHIIKRRSAITQITIGKRKNSCVPFQDGVFLCQAVGLFDEMLPLLLRASLDIPPEEENYILHRQPAKRTLPNLPSGFKVLNWNGNSILYIPSTRKINVTQLLKMNDISRGVLAYFLSQNCQISRKVEAGGRHTQGTYVDFHNARALCRHFKLSEAPIDEAEMVISRDHEHHSPNCRDLPDNRDQFEVNFSAGLPEWNLNASQSGVMDNHRLVEGQCPQLVQESDRYSQITEPNYEYGSFLAPSNQSFLQLLNHAQ